jgi:hypothetical protein
MINLKTKIYEIEEDIKLTGTAEIEDKKIDIEIEATIKGEFEIDAKYSSIKDEYIEVTIDITGYFDGNSFGFNEDFEIDELTGAIKNEFLDYVEEIEIAENYSNYDFEYILKDNINLNDFLLKDNEILENEGA